MLAMTVCLLLSLILAYKNFRIGKAEEGPHDEFGEEASGMGRKEFANIALWMGASLTAWLIMRFVGFEPAMTLFLAATLYFAGLRNYVLMACIAIFVPIILSQFTWHVFTVQTPGIWHS